MTKEKTKKPKKEKQEVVLHIRVPLVLDFALEVYCEHNATTKSQLVKQLIREHLERKSRLAEFVAPPLPKADAAAVAHRSMIDAWKQEELEDKRRQGGIHQDHRMSDEQQRWLNRK